jgi:hypothetical protein
MRFTLSNKNQIFTQNVGRYTVGPLEGLSRAVIMKKNLVRAVNHHVKIMGGLVRTQYIHT